jgi:hypothetical protein
MENDYYKNSIGIEKLSEGERKILRGDMFDNFSKKLIYEINKSNLFIDKSEELINLRSNEKFYQNKFDTLSFSKSKGEGFGISWTNDSERDLTRLSFKLMIKRREPKISGGKVVEIFTWTGIKTVMEDVFTDRLYEPFSLDYNYNNTFETLKREKILNIPQDELKFLDHLHQVFINHLDDVKIEYKRRKDLYNKGKSEIIKELDKDGDGLIDLINDDTLIKLLNLNQQSIIQKNREYIQKFILISSFLKTKKKNIQQIFEYVVKIEDETIFNEFINLLRNQIHTYESLLFHSINMVTSLVEDEMITFFEINQCFDELGVFNSTWEKEVSSKLSNIEGKLNDLMYSIYQLERTIINSVNSLSYQTQDSFQRISKNVQKQLNMINSSLNFNNLLSIIQAYQVYKINQNTKKL